MPTKQKNFPLESSDEFVFTNEASTILRTVLPQVMKRFMILLENWELMIIKFGISLLNWDAA